MRQQWPGQQTEQYCGANPLQTCREQTPLTSCGTAYHASSLAFSVCSTLVAQHTLSHCARRSPFANQRLALADDGIYAGLDSCCDSADKAFIHIISLGVQAQFPKFVRAFTDDTMATRVSATEWSPRAPGSPVLLGKMFVLSTGVKCDTPSRIAEAKALLRAILHQASKEKSSVYEASLRRALGIWASPLCRSPPPPPPATTTATQPRVCLTHHCLRPQVFITDGCVFLRSHLRGCAWLPPALLFHSVLVLCDNVRLFLPARLIKGLKAAGSWSKGRAVSGSSDFAWQMAQSCYHGAAAYASNNEDTITTWLESWRLLPLGRKCKLPLSCISQLEALICAIDNVNAQCFMPRRSSVPSDFTVYLCLDSAGLSDEDPSSPRACGGWAYCSAWADIRWFQEQWCSEILHTAHSTIMVRVKP